MKTSRDSATGGPVAEVKFREAPGELHRSAPGWASGYISYSDAHYLYACAIEAESAIAVEIGTASGVSTAIICDALNIAHEAGEIGSDFEVRSYDLRERFYCDESRRTGDAVREMLPAELLSHVTFHNPATASSAAADLEPDTLGLAFVDADHRHPWPTLDMLALLPCLRPRARIIFHDINLPLLDVENPDWGAKWLYDGLDVEKDADAGVSTPNIGSVRIPADKADLRAQLLEIVQRHEWETDVPPDLADPLLA